MYSNNADGDMTSITDTINNLTYDILGKVTKNDRSGTSGDMSYLIYKNGTVSRYNFDGGFIAFNSKGSVSKSSCRLYIQDYQGNNRMVVNADNNGIEQNTHYYPYGGLISDISSNPDLQDFKYGGKVLAADKRRLIISWREDEALAEGQDRTYGLDLYDFEARQYDATVPAFKSIDPLAVKYYGISPYAYCAGDPVNRVDPSGCDWYKNDSTGNYTWFNDDGVENPSHEGYSYVGKKGALCGEIEAYIDKIMKKTPAWADKSEEGLYVDNTIVCFDNSEESNYMDWYDEFKYNTGPEIRILTNQSNQYIKD